MTVWPVTSVTLLSQLRNADDESVWNQFAQLYRPAVYRFARRMGLQDADADDVAQRVLESVRAAFAKRPPEVGRIRFRSWIAASARNAAINYMQRDLRVRGSGRSSVVESLHQLEDLSKTDAEQIWQHEEEVLLFRTAAAEVKSNCTEAVWAAFELTAIQGQSAPVVAQKLGVSTGVVYASRSRVLKRIRNIVEQLQRDSSEDES